MKFKGRACRLLPQMSQPGFVVQRDEWHAVYAGRTADVYMNPATLPSRVKKQVVSWTNKRNVIRQQGCMDWIPFIATPKGKKEERKKQEVTGRMAYLKIQNERECVLRVEYQKCRKNRSISILKSAICKSCILSLVRQGLWQMQISASQPELV